MSELKFLTLLGKSVRVRLTGLGLFTRFFLMLLQRIHA